MRSVEGYYQNRTVDGLKFTFVNGERDTYVTEMFGLNQTVTGEPITYKKFNLGESTYVINMMMVSDSYIDDPKAKQGWDIVNFGVNDDPESSVGYENTILSDEGITVDTMRLSINTPS